MTYVIASACIDVKDGACQGVCPVDSIYQGGRMMYIQPQECINCGVCLSVCPVQAIFADDDLPASEAPYLSINEEFFSDLVTGWGAPGGADGAHISDLDHPLIAEIAISHQPT